MCRKFRTLEQCKTRYRPVTVDRSVWRVKQRGWLGIGWTFVEQEQIESSNSFTVIFVDKPATFPTQQEALAAIDKWAQADYIAQPGAWQ